MWVVVTSFKEEFCKGGNGGINDTPQLGESYSDFPEFVAGCDQDEQC